MSSRKWTILIVPNDTASPRTISVSERTLRALTPAAIVCALLAVIGLGIGISQLGSGARSVRRENQLLISELSDIRNKLDVLQDTIQTMGQREDQLRLLAGLESVDSSVREAGIGGPGLPELGRNPIYQSNPSVGRVAFGAQVDIDGLIRRANVLAASFTEITDSLSRNNDRMARTPSIMPTAGWLTSHFSRKRLHPLLHIARPHEGIDVAGPRGAPIVAPAEGVVKRVNKETGYGLVLEIDHGNGIVTKYAHCSKIVVKAGQRVTRGQVIANVGSSGLSTAPHLHYEIHVNGKVVDPLTYVLPGAIPD
jgi:murein DD-endopeptidase MepM/ murein hydrolase activator NlpD